MTETRTPASARSWQERAAQLAQDLRDRGTLTADPVAEAITTVPRHLFISQHYAHGSRVGVDPRTPTPELLDLVYGDRGIMTHTPADQAGGFSSTSQPSIVVKMLQSARIRPGMRVLEIGAGTGWNSALIARLSQSQVTTVEASAVVADEARASLHRAGLDNRVTVVTGDGYHGHAANGPYDLILVTAGVAGISPAWLEQLTRNGRVIAPIAHGGVHPLAAVCHGSQGQPPHGTLLTMADFMAARGPLYAGADHAPSTTGRAYARPVAAAARPGTVPEADQRSPEYIGLWMWLAANDSRTTVAGAEGTDAFTGPALVDGDSAVYIRPGGLHPTDQGRAAQALADAAQQHIVEWTRAGRPELDRWSFELNRTGDGDQPIRIPAQWRSR